MGNYCGKMSPSAALQRGQNYEAFHGNDCNNTHNLGVRLAQYNFALYGCAGYVWHSSPRNNGSESRLNHSGCNVGRRDILLRWFLVVAYSDPGWFFLLSNEPKR